MPRGRSSSSSSAKANKKALLALLRASNTPSRSPRRGRSGERGGRDRGARKNGGKAEKEASRAKKDERGSPKRKQKEAKKEEPEKKKARSKSRSRKSSAQRRRTSSSSSSSGARLPGGRRAPRKNAFDEKPGGVLATTPFTSRPAAATGDVAMAEEIRRAQLKAASNLQANAPSAPSDMRPGDWFCPVCATHNYSTRPTCFRCHHGANPGRPGAPPGASNNAINAAAQQAAAMLLAKQAQMAALPAAGFTGVVAPGSTPGYAAAVALAPPPLVPGMPIAGLQGASMCGDFRRGNCMRGFACRYAHT